MTKLNIFFITVASLGYSTHARKQYLRSVQSETQPVSSTANEDRSIIDDILEWLDGEDNGSSAPTPTMPPQFWSPPFAPASPAPTVSHASTTSAAPSMCIGNTIDWVDIDGDGCNWYEANDLPGCPNWGDWASNMGVANDNCCYCAGTGAPITYNPTIMWPTSPPVFGTPPPVVGTPPPVFGTPPPVVGTAAPSTAPPAGLSTPPPVFGTPPPVVGTPPPVFGTPPPVVGTAAPSTAPPAGLSTHSPTVSHAPATSAAPSMCTGNTVGWVDIFGNGCDMYEEFDLPGCPYYGNAFDGDMGSANDNCCYCAGTGAPSTPVQWPTASPIGQLETDSPTVTEVTSTSSPPITIATSTPTSAIPDVTLSPTPISTSSPSASVPATLTTCPDILDQSKEIVSGVTLFFALVPSDPESGNDGLFCGRLEAENNGWVSIGFSPDGGMIGSQAVIGVPEQGNVLKYDLTSKDGASPMSEDRQTMIGTSITVEGEKAIMEFTKLLVEAGEVPILEGTENKFIYAAGDFDGNLGYHSKRESFLIVL